MLVPLSWLKDYVDINISADELEKKLFDCGFEVEEKWQVGKDISGIVVGYVDSCEPIPETHLHVCQVNVGGPELLQICCGADNVKAGGKFPVAMIGAKVYATAKDHVTIEGVATIKKGKLRGYESQGMLCSGTELGLNEDLYPGAGYNGLLVLPEDAEIGSDVKELTGLNDWIFDVSITANRPDCQSIFGLAREGAAALGALFGHRLVPGHIVALGVVAAAAEGFASAGAFAGGAFHHGGAALRAKDGDFIGGRLPGGARVRVHPPSLEIADCDFKSYFLS